MLTKHIPIFGLFFRTDLRLCVLNYWYVAIFIYSRRDIAPVGSDKTGSYLISVDWSIFSRKILGWAEFLSCGEGLVYISPDLNFCDFL